MTSVCGDNWLQLCWRLSIQIWRQSFSITALIPSRSAPPSLEAQFSLTMIYYSFIFVKYLHRSKGPGHNEDLNFAFFLTCYAELIPNKASLTPSVCHYWSRCSDNKSLHVDCFSPERLQKKMQHDASEWQMKVRFILMCFCSRCDKKLP